MSGRSIEELKKYISDILVNHSHEFAAKLSQCREEIILAFMAKYGLQPNQCKLIYQDNEFWVEAKEDVAVAVNNFDELLDDNIIEPSDGFLLHNCEISYKHLNDKYQSLVCYLRVVLCDLSLDEKSNPLFVGIENKLKSLGELE